MDFEPKACPEAFSKHQFHKLLPFLKQDRGEFLSFSSSDHAHTSPVCDG